MRLSISQCPAEYCSITSLTSYGLNASLNLRLATKNLILRSARMAFLWTGVSCVSASDSSCWSSTSPECITGRLAGLAVWLSGSKLVSINEVTLRRARWDGWPSLGSNSRCRKPISVYNQPRRPGQLSLAIHAWLGRYQPKGGDALRLGSGE